MVGQKTTATSLFAFATLCLPSSSFPLSNFHFNKQNRVSAPRNNWRSTALSCPVLYSSNDSGREEEPSMPATHPMDELIDDSGRWKLLNDFPTFLNQVTIQSLIFMVNSLRDRHTAIWLEDFTEPIIRKRIKDKKSDEVLSNMETALRTSMSSTEWQRSIELLTFHGLGAINTTRFPTWDSYFEQLLQEETITYLVESTRPHIPTYEMEINPASLCSRLVSVRELIAREWINDLDAIVEISESMLERHPPEENVDSVDGTPSSCLKKPNLVFLEVSVHEDYKPSPLRRGNFDLLMTYTTQEAIHRILNSGDEEEEDQEMQMFLYSFYTSRIGTHFTGSNWYERADDFLLQLLETPADRLQEFSFSASLLLDPALIVQRILDERAQVAEEWIELALDVPEAHTDIKRWQLHRLMGRAIDDNAAAGFD